MKQLLTSFHTHTLLCKHASGMPDDYIEEAMTGAGGLECAALGFSDHCPYPNDGADTWHEIRMNDSEIAVYVCAVREAQKKAAFPVYLGFECEWSKNYESWYRDTLRGQYGADYLVFGPHWVHDGGKYIYAPNIRSAQQLHKYTDQTVEGIASGLYDFTAHPDLFLAGWKEWDAEARACSSAIIDAAAACSMILEINGLGMTRTPNTTSRGVRYQYPVDEFWQLAAEKNIRVICNSDAHSPEDVLRHAVQARSYAKKFGFTPIENPFSACCVSTR